MKGRSRKASRGRATGPGSRRRGSGNGRPSSNGRGALGLAAFLAERRRRDLRELFEFWGGSGRARFPESDAEVRELVFAWMTDPDRIEERVSSLGPRLGNVLEALMRAPRYRRSWSELIHARRLEGMSAYQLEACLATLGRHGFVIEGSDPRFERNGECVIAVPTEVGDGILRQRQASLRGVFQVLTLHGHLDERYSDRSKGPRMSPQRVREIYKTYSQETASVARIERLPGGVRGLVEKAILEFGGILPRQLFERMETDLPHWNGRRWRLILEQSLVGTVQDLDLTRYGIQHDDETLVVFTEVALAWLKRVAVPSDPDRPHEELSLGIDLASNISRFLAYIQENDVRFTVRGEIFKTTEKKIIQHLIPNPGRELTRGDVLAFIFAFTKQAGLIDSTGERTFAVTSSGREWGQLGLLDKQRELLGFALEDGKVGEEPIHQQRMRRIFLRLLKRAEAGVWYDLMYLPFLARNAYLSKLDDLGVAGHFADLPQGALYTGLADPQRLAWKLVRWVRRRMYLLGFVDLGYDEQKRPVAMRLTHAGARLLGVDEENGCAPAVPTVGNLVVTPDFEVVLFPTEDDAELIHDLDRFCLREKDGALRHFRITETAVRRALADGISLEHMLHTLEARSRTPVPQNVHFSIHDWAVRAGLMTLGEDLVVRCRDADTVRRFLQDPGARPHVAEVLDDTTVRLKGRITPRRMRSLLRDLGYLVELEKAR